MKKYLIKINGNQYEVEVEEIRNANLKIPQETKTEAIEIPASASSVNITAPMPGTILKINVNPGDIVKKGQVLLILEAMKMENEIMAPSDGKVTAVNISQGASVKVGDILVSIA